VSDVEIGRAKRASVCVFLDDIAPCRVDAPGDPQDVSVNWGIDAYQFSIPFHRGPDGLGCIPATAILMGSSAASGCLDLEGLWTRYEDPEPMFAEIRALPPADAIRRMQVIYTEPKPELVISRLAEICASGVTVAAAPSLRAHAGTATRRSRPGSTCS
jgi:IMP dehydrogenase